MGVGIVIGTWSGGFSWVKNLLSSLDGSMYPIYVAINDSDNVPSEFLSYIRPKVSKILGIREDRYEMGAFYAATYLLDLDFFFFLQDTTEVVNHYGLYESFELYPDDSISYGNNWNCYLGKFSTEILKELDLPIPINKWEAIAAEALLPRRYVKKSKELGKLIFNQYPPFHVLNEDENYLCYKNGRYNIVQYSPYILKYLGVKGNYYSISNTPHYLSSREITIGEL